MRQSTPVEFRTRNSATAAQPISKSAAVELLWSLGFESWNFGAGTLVPAPPSTLHFRSGLRVSTQAEDRRGTGANSSFSKMKIRAQSSCQRQEAAMKRAVRGGGEPKAKNPKSRGARRRLPLWSSTAGILTPSGSCPISTSACQKLPGAPQTSSPRSALGDALAPAATRVPQPLLPCLRGPSVNSSLHRSQLPVERPTSHEHRAVDTSTRQSSADCCLRPSPRSKGQGRARPCPIRLLQRSCDVRCR